MNQAILLALIGASGTIFGAIVSSFISAYTARQKIKELEISYQQKLDETERTYQKELEQSYLANVRAYKDEVFFPLNRQLAELEAAYHAFRNFLSDATYSRLVPMPNDKDILARRIKEAINKYQQECRNYLHGMDIFLVRNDSYLIGPFEKKLKIFNQFIRDSSLIPIDVSIVIHSMFKTSQGNSRGITVTPTYENRKRLNFLRRRKKTNSEVYSLEKTIDFYTSFEEQMVPAMIASGIYGARFRYGMQELKSFVKEVTIGMRNNTSVHTHIDTTN